MLNLPRPAAKPSVSRYAPLGLKEMPFPNEPVVNPYGHDERRNGTIYATNPVQNEIDKFERMLIRPDDFTNRARLAYLWSRGDQLQGRGMGKTALLRYFRQRINKDWGYSEFNGQFSALVVYVSFPNQVDRRYIEQMALSALVDICKSGVLLAARAALRLGALSDEQVEAVLHVGAGTPNTDNLLNDAVLEGQGIDPDELDGLIAQLLMGEGVQENSAVALSQGNFENYLKSFRRDNSLEPLFVPRDTKILDYSRTLLFNDMVNYLRAANFSGGYLFIDDIENLVDQMARRDRIEFAKEFALCTVRPGYANTAHGFFSCVLTTHQQSAVGLAAAWSDAGLSSMAPLDPNGANSVELPIPGKDQARQILIAHLDHYRVNEAETGTIKPFTQDGIDALLKQQLLPRVLLASAAKIVDHAATVGAQQIDEALVKSVDNLPPTPTTADPTDDIQDAL